MSRHKYMYLKTDARWDIRGQSKMKKLIIALSAVLMTAGFVACDDDFAEGFRYGWNSTTPSEWHYAPEYQGEADAEEAEEPVEENVNEIK